MFHPSKALPLFLLLEMVILIDVRISMVEAHVLYLQKDKQLVYSHCEKHGRTGQTGWNLLDQKISSPC